MIVDWLSFTLPCPILPEGYNYSQLREHVEKAINQLNDRCPIFASIKQSYIETANVPPYATSYRCANTGVVIRVHPARTDYLVSVSGEACQLAREGGYMKEFIGQGVMSASRLDIAYDIKTDCRPFEILDAGYSARIKTTSKLQSPRGETVYFGSRTSDVFVRVYRYEPPHPRAALLRFEAELKGKTARIAAGEILMSGVDPVGRGVFQRLEFQHDHAEDWFNGKTVTFQTETHKRSMAKTEMWLIKQAAPAFRKLVMEGVIDDPSGWLQEYFLGGNYDR